MKYINWENKIILLYKRCMYCCMLFILSYSDFSSTSFFWGKKRKKKERETLLNIQFYNDNNTLSLFLSHYIAWVLPSICVCAARALYRWDRDKSSKKKTLRMSKTGLCSIERSARCVYGGWMVSVDGRLRKKKKKKAYYHRREFLLLAKMIMSFV